MLSCLTWCLWEDEQLQDLEYRVKGLEGAGAAVLRPLSQKFRPPPCPLWAGVSEGSVLRGATDGGSRGFTQTQPSSQCRDLANGAHRNGSGLPEVTDG